MSTTILCGARETSVGNVVAEDGRLWLPLSDLTRATGWELKTQGLCQAEACVPVPKDARGSWIDERAGRIDLAALATHLHMPIVRDEWRGRAKKPSPLPNEAVVIAVTPHNGGFR